MEQISLHIRDHRVSGGPLALHASNQTHVLVYSYRSHYQKFCVEDFFQAACKENKYPVLQESSLRSIYLQTQSLSKVFAALKHCSHFRT